MNNQLLIKLDNLVEGTVIKRPSKFIKSPYVADVIPLSLENEVVKNQVLAHTASLGCCGLADTNATILMNLVPNSKSKNKNVDKLKCEYRVYLSVLREKGCEIIIGIHPKLAEELTETALKCNYLSKLQNIQSYRRETAIFVEGKVDSRFDFSGIDENGVPFIMEVKNVPLADYEDITAKDRKGKCYDDRSVDSKVAYFPDGYRKKSADPVSPRALKHIRELTLIKKESVTRCIMCYVIQRTDVNCFQPSIIDPEYREAVRLAIEAGVEMITMVVQWTKDGQSYFVRDDLPFTSFNTSF
jgi:DNA-binding sugar fermentation-stimulating protein